MYSTCIPMSRSWRTLTVKAISNRHSYPLGALSPGNTAPPPTTKEINYKAKCFVMSQNSKIKQN